MTRGYVPQNGNHEQRGFTLLEVLIALVILSIGLLGIAALQGVGLRSSHGAYLDSQASLLAYDMADRIRANPEAFAAPLDLPAACPSTLPQTPLEAADRAEWSCAITDLLPAGTGQIEGTVSPLDASMTRYTITIEWEERQPGLRPLGADEEPTETRSFVLEIDL